MFNAIIVNRRLVSIVSGNFGLGAGETAVRLPAELGLAEVLTLENWSAASAWLIAEDLIDEPETVAPVSPAITQRQLRLTLAAHGLLEQVDPAIAALPEPQKTEASIEWRFASVFQRNHPLIAQLGSVLDLDDAAIDAMWEQAAAR